MTVRDDYAAEARDEHVTELDNVLYIIIALFKIYGKNNGNMVVGEIPEFFQFPKRDICTSTARCKCTHYVFTYKGIKVVIRTEFINMTVLLCMKAFFNGFFFT